MAWATWTHLTYGCSVDRMSLQAAVNLSGITALLLVGVVWPAASGFVGVSRTGIPIGMFVLERSYSVRYVVSRMCTVEGPSILVTSALHNNATIVSWLMPAFLVLVLKMNYISDVYKRQ